MVRFNRGDQLECGVLVGLRIWIFELYYEIVGLLSAHWYFILISAFDLCTFSLVICLSYIHKLATPKSIIQLRDSAALASSSYHYLSPAYELSLGVCSSNKQYNTNLQCIKRR